MEALCEILKLDIDCFHEMFEYLSLHDLISIGNTCKRLQNVAGVFYRTMYASKRITGSSYNLTYHLSIFRQFIPKLSISGNNLRIYKYVGTHCKSVKELRLSGCLPEGAIHSLTEILKWTKVLEMSESFFHEEFHEYILKHCQKFQTLSVKRSDKIRDKSIIIGTGNGWLCRKYPTLEHFELTEIYELQRNELITFFQQNPNVRTFSTDSESLWANRHSISASNIKLEKLAIELTSKDSASLVYNLLLELHENGFFNRLHVYSTRIPQQNLDQMFALPFKNSIEMLHGDFARIDTSLENLRVLGVDCADKIANIEILPSKMPHLQRIFFTTATINQILPFIRGSKHLMTIKIMEFIEADSMSYHSFDTFEFPNLMELNEEREKLDEAEKVNIYVNERLFLALKWTRKTIELPLIEIRRCDSLEWVDLNADFRHNHSAFYF